MPKRTDFRTILIIDSGPIDIGQACELDPLGFDQGERAPGIATIRRMGGAKCSCSRSGFAYPRAMG